MNRSRHDLEGDGEMQRQIHQMAQKIFTDEPEPIGEQEDLKKLFVRILEREDWTDRLAAALDKIRNKITPPKKRVKVSKEPRFDVNHPHTGRKPSEERRAMMNRSHWDTKLPAELRLLVPDMREVEKAYVEMTTGYKEFIRDVLKSNRLREKARSNSSPIEES